MTEVSFILASATRLHPMVIHFPIALWIVALLLWVTGAVRQREDLFTFGRWLLYLAGAGAIAALITGYIASNAIGHDTPGHDLVHTHRNLMIVATLLGVATAVAAFLLRKRKDQLTRWLLVGGLVATVAVTAVGADRGGTLVYEHGVGTAPASGGTHAKPSGGHGGSGHAH